MPKSTPCPSCRTPMDAHALASVAGGTLELDLCFACHGIWFDPQENLRLTPAAVVALFKLLHAHRDDDRQPLAQSLGCPRCSVPLVQGFDVVRNGRYITYRCAQRHGRFSAFSSFMIEKGFVRQLSGQEIDDMAQRVAVIYCSGCGAPVDLRKDHACPHCRAAFSLLDPQAVERAMKGYETAALSQQPRVSELADALMMLERDRQNALRDGPKRRGLAFAASGVATADLWAVGVEMVAKILD